MSRRRHAGVLGGLLALTIGTAGCTFTPPQAAPAGPGRAEGRVRSDWPTAAPSAGAKTHGASPSTSRVVVTGRGWGRGGLTGPIPAPGTCHYRHVPGSHDVLPDPRCTPGAIDRAVTPSTIDTTVCRPGGYTGSVRPPESLTDPVKIKIMAAYGLPASAADRVELDHLVPLTAGGSSDVRNLWPEPNRDQDTAHRSAYVLNDKDALEDEIRDRLCYDDGPLRRLQRRIAIGWVALEHALNPTGSS